MSTHPVLEYYKDDLKENRVRRGIAFLIDSILIGVAIFVLSLIPLIVLMNANPPSIVIGFLISIVNMNAEGMAPTWQTMIPFTLISTLVAGAYLTVMESNGRTTLGKRAMHLDVIKQIDGVLSPTEALMRNLTKLVSGLVGVFLMGLFGAFLFTGIACIIDLLIGTYSKEDVRQRMSEISQRTWVSIEDDPLPFGTIAIPEDERKKKVPAPVEDKPKGASGFLTSGEKKEEVSALPPAREEEAAPGKSIEEEPSKEKVPFWKKWFQKGEEKAVEDVDTGKHVQHIPVSQDAKRKETILRFMFDFDISEERAEGIYEMGYRRKEELAEAIPRDLMMIDTINPTVAKKIIQMASEE